MSVCVGACCDTEIEQAELIEELVTALRQQKEWFEQDPMKSLSNPAQYVRDINRVIAQSNRAIAHAEEMLTKETP